MLVLPNDASAVLAAESAAAHAARPARVLPSRSLAEGVCALVAYLPDADIEANGAAMARALAGVRSGEVSRARARRVDRRCRRRWPATTSRSPAGGRSRRSVAPEAALRAAAESLLETGGDVLTVLLGEGELAGGTLAATAAALASTHPGLEVAVHEGGQAHPIALLAVE